MAAFSVTHEVTIDHRELGREVWEWNADEQALFLSGFAEVFKAEPGVGLLQIHYIAESLRKGEGNLAAVRWLNDRLTEYLKEENA